MAEELKVTFEFKSFLVFLLILIGIDEWCLTLIKLSVGLRSDVMYLAFGGIGRIMSIVWSVFIIIISFKFKKGIEDYCLIEYKMNLRLNSFYTFIFGMFYIVYCINDLENDYRRHQMIMNNINNNSNCNTPNTESDTNTGNNNL